MQCHSISPISIIDITQSDTLHHYRPFYSPSVLSLTVMHVVCIDHHRPCFMYLPKWWGELRPHLEGSFVKHLNKALRSILYMGWKVIYCILISCADYGGTINSYVNFFHQSYKCNYLARHFWGCLVAWPKFTIRPYREVPEILIGFINLLYITSQWMYQTYTTSQWEPRRRYWQVIPKQQSPSCSTACWKWWIQYPSSPPLLIHIYRFRLTWIDVIHFDQLASCSTYLLAGDGGCSAT